MSKPRNHSLADDLLTPAQAAEFKGVSRTAVYSAIAENRLPCVRILGRLALKKSDLKAWKPVRYAGRSKGFTISPEIRARMSQGAKQMWKKRKAEQVEQSKPKGHSRKRS